MPPPNAAARLFAVAGLNRDELLSSCILKHPDSLASVEKAVLDFLTKFFELDANPDAFDEAALLNLKLRVDDLLAVGLKVLEPFQTEVCNAHKLYQEHQATRQQRTTDQLAAANLTTALEATQQQVAELMNKINDMLSQMQPIRARLEAPPPPSFSSQLLRRNLEGPPQDS